MALQKEISTSVNERERLCDSDAKVMQWKGIGVCQHGRVGFDGTEGDTGTKANQLAEGRLARDYAYGCKPGFDERGPVGWWAVGRAKAARLCSVLRCGLPCWRQYRERKDADVLRAKHQCIFAWL